MLAYVITVTKDYIDSISTDTKIVRSEHEIKATDTALLSYILGCDLVNSDHISVEVSLLDDVVETFSSTQETTLLFIEKFNGVFHVHKEQVGIVDLSLARINAMLKTEQVITGPAYYSVMDTDGDRDVENYAFVIDLGRAKPSDYNAAGRFRPAVRAFLAGKALGPHIITPPHHRINEHEQPVKTQVMYFPQSNTFAQVETVSVKYDKLKCRESVSANVSFYDMSGKLLSASVIVVTE